MCCFPGLFRLEARKPHNLATVRHPARSGVTGLRADGWQVEYAGLASICGNEEGRPLTPRRSPVGRFFIAHWP